MSEETSSLEKLMPEIQAFINDKFGSISAFKLLKRFVEFILAREIEGAATYELIYGIAPSEVITRNALVKIECAADGNAEKEAEEGLGSLIKKGILTCDAETGILDLGMPLASVTNIYLKKEKSALRIVSDEALADVILLHTIKGSKLDTDDLATRRAGAVLDVVYKQVKYTILEFKFGKH